jgi:phospholipid/cholesterol/gamma-HCH transport system ATP-binding protein
MIEIKNLTVGFADKIILDNITLDIPKNQTTVIIGRSGSGKSVLMKTVEGLFHPLEGQVLIDGVNIHSVHGEELLKTRRLLAMLFQGAALFDSLNVFQNVALPLVEHTNTKLDEINKLVEEKIQMVGLKNVMNKMPSELSGGMRKRIALARAIILEPEYVIFDEPTTGLDPVSASEIIDLIIYLQKTCNISAIIITHDLDCIRRTGQNIAMLHETKLIFTGSYEEIMQSSKPEVKAFFNPGQ